MPDFSFENALTEYKFICGADEAGRGPLFGSVFAAAVILDKCSDNSLYNKINDSKKLTHKKREELFIAIKENALCYAIAYATPNEIDQINIRNAAFLAMQRAIMQISRLDKQANIIEYKNGEVDYALIDGNAFIKDFYLPYDTIVKGDSKSLNIAAASILAKVARDREMIGYDAIYPDYGFAKHKGYPTKEHYEAIKKYGVLEEHRKSFRLY